MIIIEQSEADKILIAGILKGQIVIFIKQLQ